MKNPLKLVAVMKNGYTRAQMRAMEERWINHPGPYLTLAQVIAIEKAKQGGGKGNENASVNQSFSQP